MEPPGHNFSLRRRLWPGPYATSHPGYCGPRLKTPRTLALRVELLSQLGHNFSLRRTLWPGCSLLASVEMLERRVMRPVCDPLAHPTSGGGGPTGDISIPGFFGIPPGLSCAVFPQRCKARAPFKLYPPPTNSHTGGGGGGWPFQALHPSPMENTWGAQIKNRSGELLAPPSSGRYGKAAGPKYPW